MSDKGELTVAPISPDQANERRIRDEDLVFVNSEIERTFDGDHAVVLFPSTPKPRLRPIYESVGWKVEIFNFLVWKFSKQKTQV